MVTQKVIIKNDTGLHLRPAGNLCKIALQYPCKVELRSDNRTVNAKSVLGLLSACVRRKEEVEIICDGEKEQEALNEIVKAIERELV